MKLGLFNLFFLIEIRAQSSNRKWRCPSGRSSTHTTCCRSEPVENPQIISLEFPENLPLNRAISFEPAIEIDFQRTGDFANISIYDDLFVSGIQGLNICSDNTKCAGDIFEHIISDNSGAPTLNLIGKQLTSFNLSSEINLREMGGGQFRFGFTCSSLSFQEEYQVELTILEVDGSPWQSKPVINGINETRIYEGQRGEIARLKLDSYDFLKEDMLLELQTIPENLRDFIYLDIQPNFLLPYARPGEVKFSENVKVSLNSPLDPNDFGGEFGIVLRAKSWIDNETLGIWSDNFTINVRVEDVDNLPPVFLDENTKIDISLDNLDENLVIFNATAVDGDQEINTPVNVTILEGELTETLTLVDNLVKFKKGIRQEDLIQIPDFATLELEARQLDNPKKKTTKTLLLRFSKDYESELMADECSCDTVSGSPFTSEVPSTPGDDGQFFCKLYFEKTFVTFVERKCEDFKTKLSTLELALIIIQCIFLLLAIGPIFKKFAPKFSKWKNDTTKTSEEHEQIEVKNFPELKEKNSDKVHQKIEKRKSMNPLVDSDRTHHKIDPSTILYGQIIKSGSIKSIQKVALAGETSFGDDIGPSFDKIVKKSKIEKLLGQECIHLSAFINLLNLKNLTHENILKYHGSFLENNENGNDFSVGIVWDLADQGSLEELFSFYRQNHWKRLTDLTEARFQNWIRNIIGALQYFHENDVILGRLSCKNILIDTNMNAKIEILPSTSMGDLHEVRWWSIERFEGQLSSFSSDIWMLGVTIWQIMNSGATPYGHLSGPSLKEELFSLLKVDRLSMTRSIPEPLYGVLSNTWKRDAELRPDIAQIKIDTEDIFSKGPLKPVTKRKLTPIVTEKF